MAFNLTRATGCLAGAFHVRATTVTIRDQLIPVPARLARSGRKGSGELTLHLPRDWHTETSWNAMFTAATGPPGAAA
jgi:hypothetical protein